MERQMQIPLDPKEVKELRAGDYVKLSGIIYTARDAAHKRMSEALERGEKLPIDIEGTYLLYGAIAGEGRASHWIGRTYHRKQNG